MKIINTKILLAGIILFVSVFVFHPLSLHAFENSFDNYGADNEFAIKLYSELSSVDSSNICFSPVSIFSALSMVYEGADGRSAEQMEIVLDIPNSREERVGVFSELFSLISSDRESMQVQIANSLWVQEKYPVKSTYISLLKEIYLSEIMETNFISQPEQSIANINGWVEKKTKGKIVDLFQDGSIDDMTRLVLVNAVYFLGDWESPFERSRTSEQEFKTGTGEIERVPFMRKTDTLNYYSDDKIQVVELSYSGGDYSLLVLLPEKEDGLEELEESLFPEVISRIEEGMTRERVELHFPKYEMKKRIQLSSVLDVLGMSDIFSMKEADLTGICDEEGLYVSDVVHASCFRVDEKGTEAAAATGIGIKAASIPVEPVLMNVDHPFIFILSHKKTKSFLFMGRVMDPSVN